MLVAADAAVAAADIASVPVVAVAAVTGPRQSFRAPAVQQAPHAVLVAASCS